MMENICFISILEYSDHYLFGYKLWIVRSQRKSGDVLFFYPDSGIACFCKKTGRRTLYFVGSVRNLYYPCLPCSNRFYKQWTGNEITSPYFEAAKT
jgi:hypothetical protein